MRNDKVIAGATAFATAAAAMTLAGCSQKPRETTAVEADPSRAAEPAPEPPPMFEAVPADTPYLLASLDAWPEALDDMNHPFTEGSTSGLDALAELGAEAAAESDGAFSALHGALFGLVEEDGVEALGMAPGASVVLYGLGLVPVGRVELADADALRGALSTIEDQADVTLPVRDVAGHEVYWFDDDQPWSFGAAILGDELVVSFGPESAAEAAFEVLVGAREVGDVMSEADIRARAGAEGFLDGWFGMLDVVALGELLVGQRGGVQGEVSADMLGGPPDVPAGCAEATLAALGHAPTLTAGYTEMDDDRVTGVARLELSDELTELFEAARASVPGVVDDFDEVPLFALGAAVDVEGGARLLEWAGETMAEVGAACDSLDLQEGGTELAELVGGPVAPHFAMVSGGLFWIESIDLATFSGEGYAVAGIEAPMQLFELAQPFLPELGDLELSVDGTFRALPEGIASEIPVDLGWTYALSDAAVALAAGDAGRAAAESALDRRPEESPFLTVAADYDRLSAFAEHLPGGASEDMSYFGEPFSKGVGTVSLDGGGLRLKLRSEVESDVSPED